MFKRISPERRQALKEKIEEQRRSSRPIIHWCKENGIGVGQFYYWKEQFFPKELKRSEFLELSSSTGGTGIRLECNGVTIEVEPQFDESTLRRCLILMRALPC